MAKVIYAGANGVATKIKKLYAGANGQANAVKKVYVGVNGQATLAWSAEIPRTVFMVEAGSKNVSVSTDGTSFTLSPNALNMTIPSVFTKSARFNGKTYLYDGINGIVYSTSDGYTFESKTIGTVSPGGSGTIKNVNGHLLIFGYNGGKIYYSNDGDTWTMTSANITHDTSTYANTVGIYDIWLDHRNPSYWVYRVLYEIKTSTYSSYDVLQFRTSETGAATSDASAFNALINGSLASNTDVSGQFYGCTKAGAFSCGTAYGDTYILFDTYYNTSFDARLLGKRLSKTSGSDALSPGHGASWLYNSANYSVYAVNNNSCYRVYANNTRPYVFAETVSSNLSSFTPSDINALFGLSGEFMYGSKNGDKVIASADSGITFTSMSTGINKANSVMYTNFD